MHASRLLLETTGDLKSSGGSSVSVNINNSISAGYVIDLTPHTRMGVTDHQPQIEAKPLKSYEHVRQVGPIGNGTMRKGEGGAG